MLNLLDSFNKKKDYLVCIDSDGCAMDTMESKHILCFGPAMIQEWGLGTWGEAIQNQWNAINLFTMTRGINRFLGLYLALESIDRDYKKIDNLDRLKKWVETAKELSNDSLAKEIENHSCLILKKALNWSEVVNRSIVTLPEENKQPFEGVKICLERIHNIADVAVVSSANRQAIEEEWEKHGLLSFTDVVLSQDAGSKADCIKKLLAEGYDRDKTLMVGDAPGDRDAAKRNEVLFYPILVRREPSSWERLLKEGINVFLTGGFKGEYQDCLMAEFEEQLNITDSTLFV